MLRTPSRPRPRRRRLSLERLEDRYLLAAELDLSGLRLDLTTADPSHILVRFRDGAAAVALAGTSLGRSLDLVPGLYEVHVSPGSTVEEALAAYLRDDRVLSAEPDYLLSAAWTPNDPRFGEQWNLRNTGQNGGTAGADVRATSAWDVTTGGKRTAVAILDSGIDYTHPDLYLNVWVNQGEIPASRRANLIDVDGDGGITFRDLKDPRNKGAGKITDVNNNGYIDAGDVLAPMTKDAQGKDTGLGGWADGASQDGDKYVDDLVGWNSNANTNNPYDDFGHGSHVAGTIGATGNNGTGVAGVNWQVQLAAVKFFNSHGQGTVSQIIAGLDWALAKGIKISNNSWTDPFNTPALFEAVKRAQARGHLFVAAAGNNARNTDTAPVYPAGFALDNVVSVGATDRYDRLASFSNWGTQSVDIAAPGVDVLSTTAWKSYNVRSGTSMSTPHVVGVVAMVWTLRPEWNYRQVIGWVLQTADRLPSLSGKVASGRLNAAAAVRVPPRTTVMPASFVAAPAPAPTGSPAAGGAAPASTATLDEAFSSPLVAADLGWLAGLLAGASVGKKDGPQQAW